MERLSAEESLFFSKNFLVQRPILRSFLSDRRSLLLIDEVDRSDDEFEALLLDCLSDFQSIPELGVIEAKIKPLVIYCVTQTIDTQSAPWFTWSNKKQVPTYAITLRALNNSSTSSSIFKNTLRQYCRNSI